MSEKHIIKFSAIMKYFKEEERLVARGESAYESGHVLTMNFDNNLKLLRGAVLASMKDKEYKVEIRLNSNWDIENATCTCPRGQLLCHHMAALALFGRYNISITDQECTWIKQKSIGGNVEKLTDIYPEKQHRSTEKDMTPDEINGLLQKLNIFEGAVEFTWLLSKEVTPEEEVAVAIEDVIFSNDYLESNDKIKCLEAKLQIEEEHILLIAAETAGQSQNPKWQIARKNRLKASNFAVVLTACRRNRFSHSLFKRLAGSYDIDHIKAVQWSRQHEKIAIEAFEQSKNLKVLQTGLWLHKCGYIGASPDGLIGDNAIIEIKCPYKYRCTSMLDSIKHVHNYIIVSTSEGAISINRSHEYLEQIQGTMAITGRSLCYLVIWTPSETVTLEVPAENFCLKLETLKNFYLNNYIKYLTGEKDVSL